MAERDLDGGRLGRAGGLACRGRVRGDGQSGARPDSRAVRVAARQRRHRHRRQWRRRRSSRRCERAGCLGSTRACRARSTAPTRCRCPARSPSFAARSSGSTRSGSTRAGRRGHRLPRGGPPLRHQRRAPARAAALSVAALGWIVAIAGRLGGHLRRRLGRRVLLSGQPWALGENVGEPAAERAGRRLLGDAGEQASKLCRVGGDIGDGCPIGASARRGDGTARCAA